MVTFESADPMPNLRPSGENRIAIQWTGCAEMLSINSMEGYLQIVEIKKHYLYCCCFTWKKKNDEKSINKLGPEHFEVASGRGDEELRVVHVPRDFVDFRVELFLPENVELSAVDEGNEIIFVPDRYRRAVGRPGHVDVLSCGKESKRKNVSKSCTKIMQ